MSHYSINADQITNWESFHNIFLKTFSFPSYYGHNMNAWIDCMSDIVEQEDMVFLNFENIDNLKKRNLEIYEAIVESLLFINRRFSKQGKKHRLVISCFERNENNLNSTEIQNLIASAKQRGFIYRHEILEILPVDICDTDQIDDIVEFISEMGILIRE